MNPDPFAITRTRVAEREALASAKPSPFVALLRSAAGFVVVHPSTVAPVRWQVTLFLSDEPHAHRGPFEWAAAVEAAYEYGADLGARKDLA